MKVAQNLIAIGCIRSKFDVSRQQRVGSLMVTGLTAQGGQPVQCRWKSHAAENRRSTLPQNIPYFRSRHGDSRIVYQSLSQAAESFTSVTSLKAVNRPL